MLDEYHPSKVAVLFMGIPASGKSTYYARYFPEYVRINLDTLHTRNKEQTLLEACLLAGKPFVVDNTNPTKMDRQRYIAPAKAAGYQVEGYFFQSVVKDCVERNAQRTGKAKIPSVAVAAISNQLELPHMDDGFDKLYFVRMSDGGFIVEPWRDDI